jgi:hypothetical protein
VNDLENVLFEVGNEHYSESAHWQNHVVELVHEHEACLPQQHPVGITSGGGRVGRLANAALFTSRADWISPGHRENQPYRDDPPAADGSKVIISDTDHLWGLGATRAWVWMSLTRGLNPILMDPYEPLYGLDHFPHWGRINRRDAPFWEPIRRAMAHAATVANRLDLSRMTPRGDLSSTRYCLAAPGVEYLVYSPFGGAITVDLSGAPGIFSAVWISPDAGKDREGGQLEGGAPRYVWPPTGGDAVLHIRRMA